MTLCHNNIIYCTQVNKEWFLNFVDDCNKHCSIDNVVFVTSYTRKNYKIAWNCTLIICMGLAQKEMTCFFLWLISFYSHNKYRIQSTFEIKYSTISVNFSAYHGICALTRHVLIFFFRHILKVYRKLRTSVNMFHELI